MEGGLFSQIGNPEFMAGVEERRRIVRKIAQQMGLTSTEAERALWHFECTTSSEGQEIH